jgi:two-component system LytT family response regulator
MIRTLIIDDELHIRDTLEKLLEKHCPEVDVVGLASGVESGMKAIRKLDPELVLLDLYMGDGTGFDLLHALAPIRFHVIFISAMDRSTIRAFKLSGMEYVLKPVSPVELVAAIARVMKTTITDFGLQLEALEGNVGQ